MCALQIFIAWLKHSSLFGKIILVEPLLMPISCEIYSSNERLCHSIKVYSEIWPSLTVNSIMCIYYDLTCKNLGCKWATSHNMILQLWYICLKQPCL